MFSVRSQTVKYFSTPERHLANRFSVVFSYIVCSGIVDNLQTCFNCVGGPVDNDQVTPSIVLESLETLCAIARYYSFR
jgi:hypothetical protein